MSAKRRPLQQPPTDSIGCSGGGNRPKLGQRVTRAHARDTVRAQHRQHKDPAGIQTSDTFR